MPAATVTQLLKDQKTDPELISVINVITACCQEIAEQLRLGALTGILGATVETNVQGETQKQLDVIANDILKEKLLALPLIAGIASEEEDLPVAGNKDGRFLVLFDPLDGSSNIDVNVSVGTIFSILEVPEDCHGGEEKAYLQSGRKQLAAGYALYGPAATLTLSTGKGVQQFSLDNQGSFLLTQAEMSIPQDTKEFAINMSNQRFWQPQMQAYIGELVAGKDGSRGKNFNMRWIASMVADVHRVLTRGGIFTYPWDNRDADKPGKLRLMYEGNPMSFLVEQAGGLATTCFGNILDIQPQKIHQRVSVALGSKNEIEVLLQAHQTAADSQAASLNK
ncbi:class 1 fructose-bisphosphatase [Sessilibacter corallicola]|uniref:class 1 fructose-bisphosphatase n=1 Tax=Sessilibacter corallicola TaxID=2904075 RepID=UPI001E3BEDBA|nr:class 1 fructose-bisphosphatase [Sessilibacter corallicola]MCE2028210.1 class 1 fructose-bisphosphatase [Sessilibacter corallicola]